MTRKGYLLAGQVVISTREEDQGRSGGHSYERRGCIRTIQADMAPSEVKFYRHGYPLRVPLILTNSQLGEDLVPKSSLKAEEVEG
ncbi:unnamed protein product [Nippostrongylus brasiliensis]|uniref:DUF2158 domain-containing protein n=1 Tax=Nippostrongylus brasiliensis TaxID=27835 RepID=A0A0N4YB72_NIPBR|nr:unnamed protein product [Nippostrongylus brasiliensis]